MIILTLILLDINYKIILDLMMMNDKEKFLAEQLGECVPEMVEERTFNGVDYDETERCIKCNKTSYYHKLKTPFQQADQANKFFMLWNWAKEQEWFGKFIWDNGSRDICALDEDLINYENFSTSLYNFLKEQK